MVPLWYEKPLTYCMGGRERVDMAYEVHRILSPLCSRTEVEAKYDWTFTRIYAGEYVTGLKETFLAPGLSQGASCDGS